MSTIKNFQTFFNDYNKENHDNENIFPGQWEYIYSRSKVDWEWLYENISMLTVETSETRKSCLKMEFYAFDKMLYYINDYLSKKHDGENGKKDKGSEHKNMSEQVSSTMSKMKSSFKMPKFK